MSDMTAEIEFIEWLKSEMPAGTVIGDPEWWASRIAYRVRALSAQRVPEGTNSFLSVDPAFSVFISEGETEASYKLGVYTDASGFQPLGQHYLYAHSQSDELTRLRDRVEVLERQLECLIGAMQEALSIDQLKEIFGKASQIEDKGISFGTTSREKATADATAELEKDAARYRWIRANQTWYRYDDYSMVGCKFAADLDFQCAPMLDHHIDAARLREGGELMMDHEDIDEDD